MTSKTFINIPIFIWSWKVWLWSTVSCSIDRVCVWDAVISPLFFQATRLMEDRGARSVLNSDHSFPSSVHSKRVQFLPLVIFLQTMSLNLHILQLWFIFLFVLFYQSVLIILIEAARKCYIIQICLCCVIPLILIPISIFFPNESNTIYDYIKFFYTLIAFWLIQILRHNLENGGRTKITKYS